MIKDEDSWRESKRMRSEKLGNDVKNWGNLQNQIHGKWTGIWKDFKLNITVLDYINYLENKNRKSVSCKEI